MDMDMQLDAIRNDAWIAFGLAFVGGYGDAAGLVLAKTFTGHITGNVVLTAVAMAGRDWRATVQHLLAIATFLFGVFLSELVARRRRAPVSLPLLPIVMGIEVILIVAACLTLESKFAFRLEIFLVCVALALGMQNGAFRSAGGISVHTTYLTGMTTSLVARGTDRYVSRIALQPAAAADPEIDLLGGIWIAFALGAGTGAALIFHFGGAGLLGAAMVLVAIIVRDLVGRPKNRSVA
jgi:uncharacterized membrane protein YoaK (UPF0700 family)